MHLYNMMAWGGGGACCLGAVLSVCTNVRNIADGGGASEQNATKIWILKKDKASVENC